jgi:hypothetical protein
MWFSWKFTDKLIGGPSGILDKRTAGYEINISEPKKD